MYFSQLRTLYSGPSFFLLIFFFCEDLALYPKDFFFRAMEQFCNVYCCVAHEFWGTGASRESASR